MPFSLKAEHLYESRMEDHARDTTGPRVELQRFVAATPSTASLFGHYNRTVVYIFFRRVFIERGLFAIPLDLFDFAISSSAHSSANEARVGIRPHDVMQAIAIVVPTWRDVCVPVASLHASRGPLCFFEVLCANPRNLVQSGAHHKSTPRGLVRVRQLRGVVSATMEGTVVCDGEGRYRNLDCGAWCQNPIFEAVVSSLWVCRHHHVFEDYVSVSMACAEADMLERAKTPALRDDDLTVSGLLMLGDAPRYHELGSELVAVGTERSRGSDARAKAVEALLANAAFTDSPPSSWLRPGDDTEAFGALCRRGQANQKVSGDGRKVYAVVPVAIRPRALKR
jgi:hypothetical protein